MLGYQRRFPPRGAVLLPVQPPRPPLPPRPPPIPRPPPPPPPTRGQPHAADILGPGGAAAAEARHLCKTRVDRLAGLLEYLNEITSLLGICRATLVLKSKVMLILGGQLTVSCEESDGGALAPSTSRTADAVDIILRVVRIIKVDHMSDVLDVLRTHTKLVKRC